MSGTVVRLKGLKVYSHPKSGIRYAYHRKSGTRLKAEIGTPAFLLELKVIEEKQAAKQAKKALPGTIGLAVETWRATPEWARLKPATRISYEKALAVLKPLENVPLVQITRPKALELRGGIYAKRGRWLADYTLTVLRIVLAHAVDRGYIATNPLADRIKKIGKARDEASANRPWQEHECRAVLERAPACLKLPIALAMTAGLRRTDVLTVKLSALRAGAIVVRTSKRGVNVALPIHTILSDALASRPASEAEEIAVNSHCERWTLSGFDSSWRTFKKRLEAEGLVERGLTVHGLRHSLATRLREAGADDRTIADVLGQKSVSMARHYSENAALPAHAAALVRDLKHTEERNAA
jgi:integrase